MLLTLPENLQIGTVNKHDASVVENALQLAFTLGNARPNMENPDLVMPQVENLLGIYTDTFTALEQSLTSPQMLGVVETLLQAGRIAFAYNMSHEFKTIE
jgi:hypothetical protein